MSENVTPAKKSSDFIDLGKILAACRSKWYIIAGSVVFCLLLAFVYTRRHPEEYLVKSNILIVQDDDTSISSAQGLSSLFGSSADVQDELFAVSSHTVLSNAARRLGLNTTYYARTGFLRSRLCFNDEPVLLEAPAGISDTLSAPIYFKLAADKKGRVDVSAKCRKTTIGKVKDATFPVTLKTDFGTFVFKKTDDYPADEKVKTYITLQSYDRAAELLSTDIDIDLASRKANVIYLEMLSTNPDYAKALLDCITDEYNQRSLSEKNARNEKTLRFLDERLSLMAADLAQSERTMQQFKSKVGVPDLVAEAQYRYTVRGELEAGLTAAETESEVLGILDDFLSDPRNASELVPAALLSQGGEAVAAAVGHYNERLVFRDRLAKTASPDNKALKDLDRELATRRSNLLATIGQSAEAAQMKVRELRSQYGKTTGALTSAPEIELEFRDIERARKIKEQLYIFLLKHREERAIMLANGQFKGQIIDKAYASTEDVGISSKVIYVIAFVLGIVLAMLAIYLMSIFRNKFSTREELEDFTTVPVLGEVCTDRSGRALVVRDGGSTSAAELFRLIRSNLQFILRGKDDKVILMTSTRSGEGKSFISINLAASLALLKKRVLLVGADIRSPKLAEYLSLPAHRGLTEYLSSESVKLTDIVRRNPLGNGVDVITAGPIPPNPSELLSGQRIEDFLEEVRRDYDYIIIDSAPVGMVSDTFAFGRLADATVYVCRANYTTRADVNFFNDVYTNRRLPKMALVVNGTASKKGYGYGYGHTAEK